jgi:hypothetical protein
MNEPHEHPFGHESSAVAVRRVLIIGAILAAVVVLTAIAIHVALPRWVMPHHQQVVARRAAIPPPPRLQARPAADIAALRAQKNALLSSWQWTDPAHAFARIPIERAMALYAQQQAASPREPAR